MRAYSARLARVLDGRALVVRLSFAPFGLSLDAVMTLDAYECPELLGPEAELGARARAALERLARDKELEVYIREDGRPGRYAGSVMIPEPLSAEGFADVAGVLIAQGYGRQVVPGAPRAPFPAERYPVA